MGTQHRNLHPSFVTVSTLAYFIVWAHAGTSVSHSPGRQKKRWEDNIGEWTGLEFTNFQGAVENREKWRKLVVKSSVVPQQPLWLRDR